MTESSNKTNNASTISATNTTNATIIDGKQLAAQIREQVRLDTLTLNDKGIKPGLAVILVGEDPASAVYVKNKVAACATAGFHSELQRYPATITESELLGHIQALKRRHKHPRHLGAAALTKTHQRPSSDRNHCCQQRR